MLSTIRDFDTWKKDAVSSRRDDPSKLLLSKMRVIAYARNANPDRFGLSPSRIRSKEGEAADKLADESV